MTYQLPILYAETRGKRRYWSITVNDNIITTKWGFIDGKEQQSSREVKAKGKNTSQEQAKREAEVKWTKRLTNGMEVNSNDSEARQLADRIATAHAESGGRINNVSNVIRNRKTNKLTTTKSKLAPDLSVEEQKAVLAPMRASTWKYADQSRTEPTKSITNKIKSGFYLQPKLDGSRCLARLDSNGDVIMTSRGRKQFRWFSNHRREIQQLLKGQNYLDGLDGELCFPLGQQSGTNFAKISSICSVGANKAHPDQDSIQYHVFDLVDSSGKYKQTERFALLDKIFAQHSSKLITRVETVKLTDPAEIVSYHSKWVQDGLEGVIVRTFDCDYRTGSKTVKTSTKMFKHKDFDDDEFPIVGTELKHGVSEENFVWIAQTKTGETFKVKPTGDVEFRLKLYQSREKYTGQLLKVKYQGYSKDCGLPRFPIGLGIRPSWDL